MIPIHAMDDMIGVSRRLTALYRCSSTAIPFWSQRCLARAHLDQGPRANLPRLDGVLHELRRGRDVRQTLGTDDAECEVGCGRQRFGLGLDHCASDGSVSRPTSMRPPALDKPESLHVQRDPLLRIQAVVGPRHSRHPRSAALDVSPERGTTHPLEDVRIDRADGPEADEEDIDRGRAVAVGLASGHPAASLVRIAVIDGQSRVDLFG